MKKIILVIICLYIAFNLTKSEDNHYEVTKLYQQLSSLEDIYNRKLLIAHGIDPDQLIKDLENFEEPKEKAEYRKKFIMREGNLSEKEYQNIFIHPIQQITSDSTNTINEIKNSIYEVQDKIQSIEKLIDNLTP